MDSRIAFAVNPVHVVSGIDERRYFDPSLSANAEQTADERALFADSGMGGAVYYSGPLDHDDLRAARSILSAIAAHRASAARAERARCAAIARKNAPGFLDERTPSEVASAIANAMAGE